VIDGQAARIVGSDGAVFEILGPIQKIDATYPLNLVIIQDRRGFEVRSVTCRLSKCYIQFLQPEGTRSMRTKTVERGAAKLGSSDGEMATRLQRRVVCRKPEKWRPNQRRARWQEIQNMFSNLRLDEKTPATRDLTTWLDLTNEPTAGGGVLGSVFRRARTVRVASARMISSLARPVTPAAASGIHRAHGNRAVFASVAREKSGRARLVL